MKTLLTLPTIHSNGSSGQRLAEAYSDAYSALDDAVTRLRETAPNGRDYYLQGSAAMATAEREHMTRVQAIRDVMDQLETLAIHCAG